MRGEFPSGQKGVLSTKRAPDPDFDLAEGANFVSRRPRNNKNSPPGDGWVSIEPGGFLSLHNDHPFSPTLEQWQQWMRHLRGQVLSSSFVIENELVLLALANEFGSNDHGQVGREYFEREQQWRADYNLMVKIDRVKPIIRVRRHKREADQIIQKLSEYRELRNLFAHYPCWLEPVNDVEKQLTVGLKMFIADRTHIWEVTEEQARAWLKLLDQARISVDALRRELTGAPPLLADGSPPPAPHS